MANTTIVATLAAPVLDPVASPTNENPVTVTGLANPNTEVRLYDNGTLQASITAAQDGTFSFSAVLSDGANTLYATMWDGARESDPSATLTIEYINVLPAEAFVLTAPDFIQGL